MVAVFPRSSRLDDGQWWWVPAFFTERAGWNESPGARSLWRVLAPELGGGRTMEILVLYAVLAGAVLLPTVVRTAESGTAVNESRFGRVSVAAVTKYASPSAPGWTIP